MASQLLIINMNILIIFFLLVKKKQTSNFFTHFNRESNGINKASHIFFRTVNKRSLSHFNFWLIFWEINLRRKKKTEMLLFWSSVGSLVAQKASRFGTEHRWWPCKPQRGEGRFHVSDTHAAARQRSCSIFTFRLLSTVPTERFQLVSVPWLELRRHASPPPRYWLRIIARWTELNNQVGKLMLI